MNKNNSKKIILGVSLIASCIISSSALAGTIYFDYNKNSLVSSNSASVFLFGDVGQTANVSNLAGFNQNVTFGTDGFFNLDISTAYMQAGVGVHNTGFKVESSDAIAGYFVNRNTFTTDMTYLFDEDSLGTDYVVASASSNIGEGSQIAVHATVDNTMVTIDPKGGGAFNVTLNAGETYTYAGGATDLSGSSISASQNVAVFSGHECANVPSNISYCDTLISQMIPNDQLSSSYIVTASEGAELSALDSDIIKVIATEDGTAVTVGGVIVATLNEGEVYEFNLPANSGESIETSHPALVTQFLVGGNGNDTDPAMSVVPGINSWLDDYRLATPDGSQAFDLNYASVVIDSTMLASLALDGVGVDTSGFNTVTGTSFSQGIVDLPLGLFDLKASGDFLVMLGGGSQADSYLSFGGASFAPGISPDPDPKPNSVPEPASAGFMLLGACFFAMRKYLKK
jgi:hypothetical protein